MPQRFIQHYFFLYIYILYSKRQKVHPNINSPSKRKGLFF
ncbi:hypothetical protein GYO_3720 [Bacillus spizizenii TU-B-10]|uniref:Uncharacterized protein n=1 Tax=Bacillus spizizenii (strain DSM 15029 / JCM 12233 / NBRC 101239 / NRRL B-23049 / TU-B-10) TaxID=1052585 RepID=G4P0W6_BACS4|nr:hypothetical protein GYO_3720 [Bacillus spizizenii TU-B-10]SCV40538.1 hypothetical protein BQ1740_1660 [Bacillus subtilis]